MAGYNNSDQFDHHPRESNFDNNSSGQHSYSNLQATAPAFYPASSRSQGAVRRPPPYRHNIGEDQNLEEINSRPEMHMNSTDQEYSSPNSDGAVRKKYYDKNWKDKNRYSNNWRVSGSSSQENYVSRRFDRSRNSRPFSHNTGHNNRRYPNANHHEEEPYNEEPLPSASVSQFTSNKPEGFSNNNASNISRNKSQYDRSQFTSNKPEGLSNDNASNISKNKSQYDRRNGYKSYNSGNRYNKQKQYEKNYTSSENNFVDRPFTTKSYNTPQRKTDKYQLFSDTTNKLSTASQRERLTEMIDNNVLECMVCCEIIMRYDKIWSCLKCFHIIHLSCIRAWAKTSQIEENWRCPACQNVCAEVPRQYTCYCGKEIEPKLNPNVIAHGCDNMCLRKGKYCDHKCSILCHPGPCPECNIMVSKFCGCGATQQVVKCCGEVEIVCESTCNKLLNCEIHTCQAKCHVESCQPCTETVIQECYCGKTGRKVLCNKHTVGKSNFVCENICDKTLACGNHKCQKICHAGPCSPCETAINLIKNCYCGKTPLETLRDSCLDPIPCCDKICGKTLICGPPNKPHMCKEKCHSGSCPSCPLTTLIRCRCGHMDKEIACNKLTTKADDARCEKKCTKKRLCGKHTCKQKCCIEIDHVCPLPCNKQLTCGLHKCELTCHSGRCPPCMETSFDELYCTCGASVIYPPVHCGTKPPACGNPCSKARTCGHPPNHECHTGNCPPCFVLTKKWCYGQHEQRATIPCQQDSFSCGLPCGKPMPCGRHKCNKPCHKGDCPVPCVQPCIITRTLCGHACTKPCHDPPCPESNCKQMVPVTCLCGLQKSSKVCMELSDEYKCWEVAQLQAKMSNLSYSNQKVDLSDLGVKKPSILKILECNEECKVLERNRRLAIGLQIQNPDLSQKLTPRYSDFLKQYVKKDPKFCQRIHNKLTELVQLAKQSKQKSRSLSFESMNRDKRHFIHEYCEYFGVESAAYDAEPNRNVVATAIKDKSWLPSMSISEVLQRENGQRKVPGPVLGYSSNQETDSVSLKLFTSAKKTE